MHRMPLDRSAVTWGLVGVAPTVAITFIGSDGLVWCDAALIGYLFGIISMVFGVIYRDTIWLRRPLTRMLSRRGWDAFREGRARSITALRHARPSDRVCGGSSRRIRRCAVVAHRRSRFPAPALVDA